MSDLDILHELIEEEASAEVDRNYARLTLVLEEAGSQPPYNVKIHGLPDATIAFKADEFPTPEKIFRGDKGECKRADYIMITNTPEANWIVYIEMKRGQLASLAEVVQQLKGAQCLLAYCRAIGRTFWKESTFLDEKDYKQRFISIKNISINKRPTRTPPQSGLHNTPGDPLKINSPGQNGLRFNELISPK